MNETQRNIRAYKKALPELKERVIAVALLLLMSAAMMTSATFAWITLSRAPEVSNVSTTVAANGNLEIALVKPDGSEPAESAVGDSSATLGQSVVNANLTWGNLVNLSDESYGLNNIVLRPALLGNTTDLLLQPLKGVDYGEDGRLQQYFNEDYKFTNWITRPDGDGYFEFSETPKYGVRAISTVEYTYVNNTYYLFTQLMSRATGAQQGVANAYDAITQNDKYIDALAAMIGIYMTDGLNDSDTDVSDHVKPLYNMMVDVYHLMVGTEGQDYCFEDALVSLANTQVYLKYGVDNYVPYTYTRETLLSASTSELAAKGVALDALDDYKKLKQSFYEVLYGKDPEKDDGIYDYYIRVYPYKDETTGEVNEDRDSGKQVLMSELNAAINKMVDIGSCSMILPSGETYAVSGIGKKIALDLIMNGKLKNGVDARINKGLLVDFEKVTGCKMTAGPVDVSATYMMTINITANTIVTAAPDESLFEADVAATNEIAAADKGDYTAVAQDTYGMALDFWVRTNAESSYLVLEGNVLTKTSEVRDTGVDRDGNVVELYTSTISNKVTNEEGQEETFSEDVAVYKVEDADGNVTWYQANNHSLLYNYDENGNLPAGQTISTPIERYKTVSTVIGYEGENRIWDDKALMDTTSTTQGNGSCYVFYAEDPTQQTNSLRLLSNLRVAFIDSNPNSREYGKMVAVGRLNTENRYEENGKVTIPLELFNDGSSYLTKYEEGLAILPLERNKAHRLTAVIYLDGRDISNADVLAANDIQGQLNIQFGNTEKMEAIPNEELELATRSVSAVIKQVSADRYPDSNNGPKLDENGVITSAPDVTFSFDDASETNPMTVDVKVKVNGEVPAKVTAFFMRKVSTTQGSREGTITLTRSATEEGVYEGSYTFTAPGEYVLRTVQLDGMDYDLPPDNYPRVFIKGFGITNVTMFYAGKEITDQTTTIMTDERSIAANLTMRFATSEKQPGNVKLQFVGDDGSQVTANMTAGTEGWTGTATLTSSGVYTLQYVIIDGEYTELDLKYQKTLDVSMGMTVKVIDGGDYRNFTYEGKPVTVPMFVEIYDDNGDMIPYLRGVKLHYSASGSPIAGSNPDVTWSNAQKCYVGNVLIPGPGVYTFDSVVAAGNPLTNTINTPPTFTCASPNPPSYVDNQPMVGLDYLLSTGSNTYNVGVRLKEAQGATVVALIRNADSLSDKPVEVEAKQRVIDDQTGITTFYFEIPKQVGTNYQSGDWTITGLKLYNVYDADANFYYRNDDVDKPMIMDLSDSDDDLHVKVVNVAMKIEGKDEDLGGNTFTFMSTDTAKEAITVTITDQNGNKLASDQTTVTISDPKITYKYTPGSSEEYGGYLSSAEDSLDNVVLEKASGDGKTYTMSKPTFGYAGKYVGYSLTFEVTIGSAVQSFDYTSLEYADSRKGVPTLDMPVYTQSTVKPTVTINSVSTNPSDARYYLTSTPTSLNVMTGAVNKKLDDYNAVVYMYVAAQTGTLDQEQVAIKYPTVKLSLTGLPTNHGGATMVFPGGNGTSSTFTFAAGGTTASSTIGAGVDGVFDEGVFGIGSGVDTWPVFYPAGKQTVSQITVTYNNATYTVNLSNGVTINNPLYPPYVDYKINDSTYTGSVPSRAYSTDGETITITLPKIASWSYDTSSSTSGEFAATGNVLTSSVYTSKKGTIRYTHTQYTQTKTEYQAVSSTTYWTVTKEIIGWKIGNTTYKPGDTVTVSGNQTITAVVKATDGAKTVQATTATKYYVTYAATGSTKTNFSSTYSSYGTQVSSVTAHWTDPTYS